MKRRLIGSCSTILLTAGQTALAGALTDGSLGPRVERSGNDFRIEAALGTRRGDNLFHSFERFSIETGERATFTGPDAIRNVISRVTGGDPSWIDGQLRSEVGSADLYFINPAGVVFGPNATLDVPAAFHVSTADELRFADGRTFSATAPATSSLSVAAPEAFGFLGDTSGTITVDRSFLQAGPEGTISLIGGDITIDGGLSEFPVGGAGLPILPPPDITGALFTTGGRIALVAVDGSAEVSVAANEVTAEGRGDVSIVNHAGIFTIGAGGGDVFLFGDAVRLDAFSHVAARNEGTQAADGMIFVDAKSLDLNDLSTINGSTRGAGDGTPIRIHADRITVSSGLGLQPVPGIGIAIVLGAIVSDSQVADGGNAGDIAIRASAVTLAGAGVVSSSTEGAGNAGSIDLKADDLLIQGADGLLDAVPGIFSRAEEGSKGDAGDVAVRSHRIRIFDGGTISTNTLGSGRAGTAHVNAAQLVLQGSVNDSPASIRSDAGEGSGGRAGTVTVTAGELQLIDSGVIGSGTFGARNAGRVTVEAGSLLIDGAGSDLLTGITTQAASGSTGDAGRVRVDADQIELVNGGRIESDTNAAGDAGRVRIITDELTLRQGGEVRSVAFAGGDAGVVRIDAGRIVIRGAGAASTGIATAAASGRSGVVLINVDGGLLVDQGLITTDSGTAGGGEIRIMVDSVIHLQDSAVTTSVRGGTDPTAGNILLGSKVLVIDHSAIQANAPAGFGGNVALVADNIVVPRGDFEALLARGDISATGGDPARAGTVVVNAPEISLVSNLVILDAPLLDASALLRRPCAARRDIGASSFTQAGRGGLPPGPDAPLASPYVAAPAPGGTPPAMLAPDGCAALR